jgi:hypothetical protein
VAKEPADIPGRNTHQDGNPSPLSPPVTGWRLWLQQRAQNERANLRLFVSGAAAFFIGLGGVLYADQRLLPSVIQELLAGSGLFLSVIGGLLALTGYIFLSFSRIFRVVRTDEKHHD